jgi:hypothetical protein
VFVHFKTTVRVLITVFMAMLIAVGFSMLYTKRSTDAARRESAAAIEKTRKQSEEADRRWCSLLVLLDDLNKKAPPAPNDDIAKYRRLVHELREANGC